jgi:hypothetical protein
VTFSSARLDGVESELGPTSIVGRLFAALGYPFFSNPELQYASGTLLLIAAIYLLGLLVQAGLKHRLQWLTARAVRRAFPSWAACTAWPIDSSACWIGRRLPTSAP